MIKIKTASKKIIKKNYFCVFENNWQMSTILQILTLLGAVTLFLFGLSLLSNGLQKVAGDGMRRILAAMTSNPFTQILTGIGVTALIQSSTATTIMVVSFVNAGLLELGQAIGVIMGANIGTTVTAWIMAVFGFSFNMADFAYPLLLLGYVLLQMKKNQHRHSCPRRLGVRGADVSLEPHPRGRP